MGSTVYNWQFTLLPDAGKAMIWKAIIFIATIPLVPVTAYLYWKYCMVDMPALDKEDLRGA